MVDDTSSMILAVDQVYGPCSCVLGNSTVDSVSFQNGRRSGARSGLHTCQELWSQACSMLCRQLPKAAVPALPMRALSRRSLRESALKSLQN